MAEKSIFVSVLMSVYSEEPVILKEAIDSILNQTFRNLEFFIYLDKPDNDGLWEFLKEYASKDSRIKIHRNETNRFLAGTLNDELKVANGDYMVRMDGDDISVPERIQTLVDYMESHPDVGVASSWMKEFGHEHFWKNRVIRYSCSFEDMRLTYFYQSPIAHAPCIIRKNAVCKYFPKLYNERCPRTQDYELWSRLIRDGVVFGMVPEPLFLRRKSRGSGANPISFQIIHNQVSRRNISEFIKRYGLILPDKVDEGFLDNMIAKKPLCPQIAKKQYEMVLCIIFSNVYPHPVSRILSMIRKGQLSNLSVLHFRQLARFMKSAPFTEINNLITSGKDIFKSVDA